MKIKFKQNQINIGNEALKAIQSLNDNSLIDWLFECVDSLSIKKHQDLIDTYRKNIYDYLENISKSEYFKYKTNEKVNKLDKLVFSALESIKKSLNNRSYAFSVLDNLSEYVYQTTKSLDEMVAIRLKHYQLLLKKVSNV